MSQIADEIIKELRLVPHPEGGWYRQTYIDADSNDRPYGTAILFLLKRGEVSHWHRVDGTEVWFFHAGAALELAHCSDASGPAEVFLLGPNVLNGECPQIIVPKHSWQSARSIGDYTLVSCTVTPGFRFEGFELAPPDFDIPLG